jgi:hypothetical protein
MSNCREVGAWRSGDLWASVLRDRGPRDDGCGMRWAVVGLRPLQPPAENSSKEDGVRKDNGQRVAWAEAF